MERLDPECRVAGLMRLKRASREKARSEKVENKNVVLRSLRRASEQER